MSVSQALLGFLYKQSNYGYVLKKQYDDLYGKEKSLAFGQVYSTLARLKRDGNIIEQQEKNTKKEGPDRIKYQITVQGKKILENWLATPEKPAPNLQATLYLKTVTALLLGGEAKYYLDLQQKAHIERMRQLTKQKYQETIQNILLIDHAIFHLEADLKWIQTTISRLEELKQSIINN